MKKPVTLGIILLCVSFFIITIGYSVMQTTLSISGEVAFTTYQDVKITNMFFEAKSADASQIFNPDYSGTTFSFGVELPSLTDYYTYGITVTNYGTADVQLMKVVEDLFDINNFHYSLTKAYIGEIITATTSKTFYITFTRPDESTVTTLDSTLTLLFEEHETPNTYETDGLVLFAAGTDAPMQNNWHDEIQNIDIALTNVHYYPDEKGYYFSGTNSCGQTNQTIIPTSGDFTIETLIKMDTLPEDQSTVDKTIIAQKTFGLSGERGRFKPMNYFHGDLRFFITTTYNTSLQENYTTGVTPDTYYELTLIRSGNTMSQYVNGSLIAQTDVGETGIADGTFQIGCYDAIDSQNYQGYIYFVRVYNKALTRQEMLTNISLDTEIYREDQGVNLRDYAITLFSANSGNGLYHLADENRYVFRGLTENNYIRLGDNMWRIVSFEDGHVTKLVSQTLIEDMAFDSSGYRTTALNSYCKQASTFISGSTTEYPGCNVYAAQDTFTNGIDTGTVTQNSSLYEYLNNDFYNSLGAEEKAFLVEYPFDMGPVAYETETFEETKAHSTSVKWTGKVGLLSARDYLYGVAVDYPLATGTRINWLGKIFPNNSVSWLMNPMLNSSNTYDVNVINVKGDTSITVGVRRASRTSQTSGTTVIKFYVQPVIHINDANLKVTGNGSKENPFILYRGK